MYYVAHNAEHTDLWRTNLPPKKKCEVIADTPETKAENTKLYVVTVNELVTNEGCNLKC